MQRWEKRYKNREFDMLLTHITMNVNNAENMMPVFTMFESWILLLKASIFCDKQKLFIKDTLLITRKKKKEDKNDYNNGN